MNSDTLLQQEAITVLHSTLSRKRIIAAALQKVLDLFSADESGFLFPLPHSHDFELYQIQTKHPSPLRPLRLPKYQGPEVWVYSTGKPLLLPSTTPPPDSEGFKIGEFGDRPLMAVPIKSNSRIQGVLFVVSATREHRFQPHQLERFQSVAQHVSLALENARGHDGLRSFNLELRRQVKATTAQLRAANETLRQADIAKSELISTVAHELRTPITSISGFAKLLLKGGAGKITPEQEQFCEIIFKNSENLVRLIADLVDITKIEQGRLDMHMEPHSLNSLLKEAVLSHQASIPEPERRIHPEFPPQPATIRCDRMRLLQVINNLLSNALKYSQSGTPILASIQVDEALVTLAVESKGHPLSPEQLGKVFDKFYRIKNSSTKNISGSGLGLAISHSIIQAHGGRIWATNAQKNGNIFQFSLPRLDLPDDNPIDPSAAKAR